MTIGNNPTPISPWFVVQRRIGINTIQFWADAEISEDEWTTNKGTAALFYNLPAASRLASAWDAEVRALTSLTEAKEFGRGPVQPDTY